MKANPLWFGFLEAGTKSSPVVRSARLSTGNPKTIYLFNFNRNNIIEYDHNIVEVKLRELDADEKETVKILKLAFNKVFKEFKPREKPDYFGNIS